MKSMKFAQFVIFAIPEWRFRSVIEIKQIQTIPELRFGSAIDINEIDIIQDLGFRSAIKLNETGVSGRFSLYIFMVAAVT